MAIYKSLLKHGYAKFRLEILEYCSTDKLLQREQFYFDTYNPEYNLLKIAGSQLGSIHSEETRASISRARIGKKYSDETRAKMSSAQTGKTLSK